MAISITKENFDMHKLHSLTGVLPTGFYMLQHLTLNSYAWAGADKFNGVINFFESTPKHFLLAVEILLLWIPILFHGVYGVFIAFRAKMNNSIFPYKENTMFLWQRISGLYAFFFLILHVITTTGAKYMYGADVIRYDAWHTKLTSFGYAWLIFYALGVIACSYHLGYGLFSFCIRWGITISEKAQKSVQKVSLAVFLLGSILGVLTIGGFLRGSSSASAPAPSETTVQSGSGVRSI